ncbi:MAG: response regulator [Candidatus Omnitrophota bacterium]|nr:response regulator [Candidatus Omnitrophota bacterium]MBU2527862.1 response regulator [bacterium]MBU3929215.1 response regulator [bacterium]MBU4123660.1 response regulator [bacterium]
MNEKILVVDDEENIVDLINATLSAGGYYVITASDGKDGLEKAVKERPDLILMDVRMPVMDGFTACKNIRANPVTAKIPVIFLTASTQKGANENAQKSGADHFLTKPFDPIELTEFIDTILHKPLVKNKLLIIDDDPSIREAVKIYFEHSGFEIITAANSDEAMKTIHYTPPAIIISDILMPGIDGYQLCKKLKDSAETENIPLILLTSRSNAMDELKGFESGADSYVAKPFDLQYLGEEVNRLLKKELLKNDKTK